MSSNVFVYRGNRLLRHAAIALLVTSWAFTAGAAENEDTTPAVMAPLAPKSLVTEVTYADGRLVAVGERGHILVSDDGSDWEQMPSPVDEMLTAVDFAGDRRGWVVGHGASILHTADGGQSWQLQNYQKGEQLTFLDVLFTDENRGYAVGAFGLMMVTEDGGESWTRREVVSQQEFNIPHLNSIIQADDGALYIAAEFGLAFRSDDDGETWQKLQTPYDGSYFEVLNPRSGRIVVAGLRGHAFYTDDQGESWNQIETGVESSFFGGTVLEDGTTALVGQNAAILTGAGDYDEVKLHKLDSGNALSAAIELSDGDLLVTDNAGTHIVPRDEIIR